LIKNSIYLVEEKMELNWKKISAYVAILGALIVTATMAAVSQGPPGPPRNGFPGGPGPRGVLGPLARDLNLSDEQKAQIKKITESSEASTKELRDQLRALHESEPDPLSGTFDEAAVRAAAEARAKIEIELSVARAKMMSQIVAVLTTEQKAQLAEKRQHFAQNPPPPEQ